jgi:ADP-heptose:LPS heptosyltransferase
MALLRRPGDKGVGDTAARVFARFGAETFKAFYKKVFGKDCGCARRQEILNFHYPYEKPVRKLLLKNHLSPGDILCMTAAVHSLHRKHPGEYLVAVDTGAPQLWEHNPDVVPDEGFEPVLMHYPLVNECNQRAAHMLQGYCDFLADALKVPVPLLTNRPLIYLSEEEKLWQNQAEEVFGYKGPFWLLNAGVKQDYTAKGWGTHNFQAVVNLLRGKVVFVQVGSSEHLHPRLDGVYSLIDKTDLRQLVRLTYHAQGTLSGVTLLHHLAAALQKPAVTILGGREPVQWNAYPKCHLLHTVGMLSCCKDGGCWRSRVEKRNDGSEQDNSLCEQPVAGTPRCMEMVRPERVAELIACCTRV